MAFPTVIQTLGAHARDNTRGLPIYYDGAVYFISRSDASAHQMFSATDPEDGSFTQHDAGNEPDGGSNTFYCLSAVQDDASPELLHIIATQATTNDGSLVYSRFDMSTDTWDDPAGDSTGQFDIETLGYSGNLNDNMFCTVVERASELVFVYAGETDRIKGQDWRRIDYARYNHAADTVTVIAVAIDEAGEVNYYTPSCIKQHDSDAIHVIAHTGTANPPSTVNAPDETWARTLNASNGLETAVTSTTEPRAEAVMTHLKGWCYDDGGTTRCVFIGDLYDLGNTRLEQWSCDVTVNGSDVITAIAPSAQLFPTGIEPAYAPDVDTEAQHIAFAFEESTETFYCVWSDGATLDGYYWTSTDRGVNWGDEAQVGSDSDLKIQSANIIDRSGLKLAIVYESDTDNDPWYTEVDISSTLFFPFHSHKDSVLKRY